MKNKMNPCGGVHPHCRVIARLGNSAIFLASPRHSSAAFYSHVSAELHSPVFFMIST